MSEAEDRLVAGILASRKYRSLAPEVVRRIVSEALRAAGGEREASKWTRRKLHQAYGAFGAGIDYRKIEALVAELEARAGEPREARFDAARAGAREVLAFHASTAERAGILQELYDVALGPGAAGGRKLRVLDLGCGLGPFALPWMGLASDAEYRAVDLDTRLAALSSRYLAALGQAGEATAMDLLRGKLPEGPWDVALLLKLLPTLERQERGAASRLLGSLDASCIVLSFPRASLSGRRKGMDEQYAGFVEALAAECGLELTLAALPGESVYVCRRGAGTWTHGGVASPPCQASSRRV